MITLITLIMITLLQSSVKKNCKLMFGENTLANCKRLPKTQLSKDGLMLVANCSITTWLHFYYYVGFGICLRSLNQASHILFATGFWLQNVWWFCSKEVGSVVYHRKAYQWEIDQKAIDLGGGRYRSLYLLSSLLLSAAWIDYGCWSTTY